MKQENFAKGRLGEDMARKYLEKKGYVFVEANHRNYLGEIDLIMIKKQVLNDEIIFVEVKLKIGDDFGSPEEMLSNGKLARVQRIAEAFLVLNKNKFLNFNTRIEAICIVLNADKSISRITHYDQF